MILESKSLQKIGSGILSCIWLAGQMGNAIAPLPLPDYATAAGKEGIQKKGFPHEWRTNRKVWA